MAYYQHAAQDAHCPLALQFMSAVCERFAFVPKSVYPIFPRLDPVARRLFWLQSSRVLSVSPLGGGESTAREGDALNGLPSVQKSSRGVSSDYVKHPRSVPEEFLRVLGVLE